MTADFQSDRDITADVKAGSNRSFGIVFCAVFAVIGLLPLLGGGSPRIWALAVGIVFLAVALLFPGWLAPLNRQWTRFGLLLSRFTAPIVMAFVFFTTVTPIAIVMRLLKKDPLRLHLDAGMDSYWIVRSPSGPKRGTMKNQF
jgi:predicted ABC-type exoprotein transport system permease subunit